MIALDFETAPIEPGLQAPPPACMSTATALESKVMLCPEAFEVLRHALEGPGPVIGANLPFDLLVAMAEWPDLIPLVFDACDREILFDVQTRQKLIDIALGEYRQHGSYSLENLAKRLLDVKLNKDDGVRLDFWRLRSTPVEEWPAEYRDYSLADSDATLAVFQEQERGLIEVDRLAVLVDQHRQFRADLSLKLVAAWGLRTDRAGVAKLRAMCEARKAELEQGLLAAGLLKISKKKGQIVISRCVREAQTRMLAVNPKPRQTEKGRELKSWDVKYISVDEEACEDSGDQLLEHYSEYSRVGSLLSGHVAAMEQGTVTPIHTRFEVLLDTGRTSSSGPNVQNVRRLPGARECFVPRDGCCFIGCDFDKAELHTLAQTCIDLFHRSALADALNSGFDPHTGLGARLAHDTYEGLKAKIKAGDATAKEWRQRAKPGNFGFPGGMGPEGMQAYAKSTYGVIMTLEECRHLYEGWQEQWPEVAYDYLGWVKELTAATGFATIEHFVSGRWRGHVPFCAAANSFFQGRCADGMKAALYSVIKKCYLPGTVLYGCRVVNEIHDEFIVEAPLDRVPEAAAELQSTMVKAYNTFTPDVPVHASPVLMDRWSKKAEPLFDEAGRLTLWRYVA